jgi:23S rRNA pseudouridine1911/1915/1917 synthase
MQIPIIYENDNFLVVNKPAGLAVHHDSFNQDSVLTDWILEHYPECAEVGESMRLTNGELIARPGIVHRLDKDTSGLLLIAKNQVTYIYLKKLFQNHQIKKTYQALVYGHFKDEKGVINLSIGRSKKDPRKRLAGRGASGVLREAVTEYKVLKNFSDFAYVEIYPKTGRTHQIRVHFKAISHPVVCDGLYAEGRSCPMEMKRQALHAGKIEFMDEQGKERMFEAPLPEDFRQTLEYIENL